MTARIGDPRAALLERTVRAMPCCASGLPAPASAAPAVVLGPLAVDVSDVAIDGLLLAGDAAGFIDPMTGDGLRFAVRGAELAAHAALTALEHGWSGVHKRLTARRRAEFAAKWRFNRLVRTLVASPGAVAGASWGARLAPAALARRDRCAGDVGRA